MCFGLQVYLACLWPRSWSYVHLYAILVAISSTRWRWRLGRSFFNCDRKWVKVDPHISPIIGLIITQLQNITNLFRVSNRTIILKPKTQKQPSNPQPMFKAGLNSKKIYDEFYFINFYSIVYCTDLVLPHLRVVIGWKEQEIKWGAHTLTRSLTCMTRSEPKSYPPQL